MQHSINKMVQEISRILIDCDPIIYMYGSVAMDDFRMGWSDIDILVLTDKQISQSQAEILVSFRQRMLAKEPDNSYYRSFEGGMLSRRAFLADKSDRVVYWGTSGERITDRYHFDSFGMAELVENSILLYGRDMRNQLKYPSYHQLYRDVKGHYEAIRQYAKTTDRTLYSYGWILDIARCLYTLRTGKIISKTKAAEWALENELCADQQALTTALMVRRNPMQYIEDSHIFDYAEILGKPIQDFADVLEMELKKYAEG